MSDDRNRINVTLSDIELQEVKAVADVLGVKPTRIVYECIKAGLSGVLESGQLKQANIRFAQHMKSQIDWTMDQQKAKESGKKGKKK